MLISSWRGRDEIYPVIASLIRAERRYQHLLQQLLDEPAHLVPDACLDWVKPSLSCKQQRAVRLCFYTILFYGVVFNGAETPEMVC